MGIEVEDVGALLSEVESFAQQRIAAATERPEATINDKALAELSSEAAELGLLPCEGSDPGFALWEHCDEQGSMAFNLGLLRLVGHASAGIAFAWHRTALARMVATSLGASLPGNGVLGASIVTAGHYGLAQSHLGRFLSSADNESDRTLLSDWLDRRSHQTALVASEHWESLIWPIWQANEIVWQIGIRKDLLVEQCSVQHGFDELRSFRVRSAEGSLLTTFSASNSRKFYERVLKLDMMGMLAIGAGALCRARTLARDYAAIRKQGGKVIACHPAVQQMLGEIDMAIHQADGALERLSRPIDGLTLSEVAGLRGALHEVLCHGANQAIQVHGGIGYMRDAGPEKIVRDQNMLRLQAGGIREIPLLLAALNGGAA